MNFKNIALISAVTLLGTGSLIAATKKDTNDFEKKLTDVLDKKPEIIATALQKVMLKQQMEQVKKQKDAIRKEAKNLTEDTTSPYLGNKNGTVKIVVFLDPLCKYCKKFHPILLQAVEKHKDLKVIMKDFPIFGKNSEDIVKLKLAAYKESPAKYAEFERKTYEQEEPNVDELLKTAQQCGYDDAKLKHEMSDASIAAQIKNTTELAQRLGIEGTPAIIVNNELIPGYVELDTLDKLIDPTKKNA